MNLYINTSKSPKSSPNTPKSSPKITTIENNILYEDKQYKQVHNIKHRKSNIDKIIFLKYIEIKTQNNIDEVYCTISTNDILLNKRIYMNNQEYVRYRLFDENNLLIMYKCVYEDIFVELNHPCQILLGIE